jgi:hypothetical protein
MLGLLDRGTQLNNSNGRMLFERVRARRQHESGMDVLCTAALFKITRGRWHIPYERVACLRDRGVSP